MGGTLDCSQLPLPSAPRPRFSVVAVEFGERFGRRAEFDDLAAPRGLDGLDGGGVGHQRHEVGPAARRRLFEDDAHGLVDGEALLRELAGGLVPDVPFDVYAHRYLHSNPLRQVAATASVWNGTVYACGDRRKTNDAARLGSQPHQQRSDRRLVRLDAAFDDSEAGVKKFHEFREGYRDRWCRNGTRGFDEGV